MTDDAVKVGMAEVKTALVPQNLVTIGLGSCIGVCLWDPVKKVGGLAHIMLPDSTQSRKSTNKAKFADTGIRALVEEMISLGANKTRIVAKIAGGAQMFNFPGSSNVMRIGDRNAEAVRKCVKELNIKLKAEDTGGNFGRTIEFFTENGDLLVKTINKGQKII